MLTTKIIFTDNNEYQKARSNLDFWWPHIAQILKQHDLPRKGLS